MTSSPFAAAYFDENDELGGMDPNHPSADYYLALRRLRAMRTSPAAFQPTIKSRENTGKDSVLGIIAAESAVPVDSVQHGPSVHRCTPDRYRPNTEDEAMALKLLLSVPLPLTTTRVARALSWPEHRARRWLAKFAAKGLLVTRSGQVGGHFWSDGFDVGRAGKK